jgi:hypothetical protein
MLDLSLPGFRGDHPIIQAVTMYEKLGDWRALSFEGVSYLSTISHCILGTGSRLVESHLFR